MSTWDIDNRRFIRRKAPPPPEKTEEQKEQEKLKKSMTFGSMLNVALGGTAPWFEEFRKNEKRRRSLEAQELEAQRVLDAKRLLAAQPSFQYSAPKLSDLSPPKSKSTRHGVATTPRAVANECKMRPVNYSSIGLPSLPAQPAAVSSHSKPKAPAVAGGSHSKYKPPTVVASPPAQPAIDGSHGKSKPPTVAAGSHSKSRPPTVAGGSQSRSKPPTVAGGSQSKSKPPTAAGGSHSKSKAPAVADGSQSKSKTPTVAGGSHSKPKAPAVAAATPRSNISKPKSVVERPAKPADADKNDSNDSHPAFTDDVHADAQAEDTNIWGDVNSDWDAGGFETGFGEFIGDDNNNDAPAAFEPTASEPAAFEPDKPSSRRPSVAAASNSDNKSQSGAPHSNHSKPASISTKPASVKPPSVAVASNHSNSNRPASNKAPSVKPPSVQSISVKPTSNKAPSNKSASNKPASNPPALQMTTEFTSDQDAILLALKASNTSWKQISLDMTKPIWALKKRFKELKDEVEEIFSSSEAIQALENAVVEELNTREEKNKSSSRKGSTIDKDEVVKIVEEAARIAEVDDEVDDWIAREQATAGALENVVEKKKAGLDTVWEADEEQKDEYESSAGAFIDATITSTEILIIGFEKRDRGRRGRGRSSAVGIVGRSRSRVSPAPNDRGSEMVLRPNSVFNVDDCQVIAGLMERDGEHRSRRLAAMFHDVTGRRVSSKHIYEILKEAGMPTAL